jgi:CMP/dCMP kinase
MPQERHDCKGTGPTASASTASASTPITVAIDGPAASGKSTIGGLLAERLGYLYFDTGVMYRAVTWAALERGIAIEDEAAVTRLAETLNIEILPPSEGAPGAGHLLRCPAPGPPEPNAPDDGRQYTVLADGVDITWQIRSAEVNRQVSPVSAYVGVREALTVKQRRIGAVGGVVMVGRDIGTVVLPQAEVKIYLDASVEERARRRYREMIERGQDAEYDVVLAELRRRDRIDSSREAAPLRAADDAILLDSTDLSIEEVVERALALVRDGASRCDEP